MHPRMRIGPVCAIAGALALFIGTWMHPMNADPNVPLAAFTEYAGSTGWVTGHLMQLFGVMLMTAALVLLLRRLSDGPAAEYAALAHAGAVVGLGAAAINPQQRCQRSGCQNYGRLRREQIYAKSSDGNARTIFLCDPCFGSRNTTNYTTCFFGRA
jgi:hypothetical protein